MGLDSVELIVNVENKFEIQILDLEAEEIKTVGQLVEVIKKKTNFKNDEIFPILQKLIFKQVGFPIDKIDYDSKLVNDLGFD